MPMLPSADGYGQSAGVLARAPALAGLPRLAGKLLPLEQAHELYERIRNSADGFLLEGLLREMNVDLRVDEADVERIPKKGPVVVVANHPYGAAGVFLRAEQPGFPIDGDDSSTSAHGILVAGVSAAGG